ncbi:hypothetical protein LMG28614_02584 [Paraburkholderia ultramafica]|uniref:Uncharacterized protein n=1 Tax=Paraburkholderia ultramafica TaxID=1544867 RepID=A0A6S7CEE7_9BURK|nr:hypothetical protein [Paraburkholderia ultramafica]CAB3787830.1 hypothetical protein LMG28614_02584 [Paraburkholderia ultramafica]
MHFAFAIATSRSIRYIALAASLAVAPLVYGADPAAATAGTSGTPGTSSMSGISAAPGASSAPVPVAASAAPAAAAPDDTFLLSIFLRHDESKPLPKINDQLRAQGFFKTFPPPGIEVVSWYVMMGIGQVVTLRVPASRLREVNRAIESTAWGGYRTEFYPTYDYKAQAQQMRATEGK